MTNKIQKISFITSSIVPMSDENIDTDQIMPARFLTSIDKKDFGKHLFHDMRYTDDGSTNPDFILNDKKYIKSKILVCGHNFGCGSSREHAPWGIVQYGFSVIISSKFAPIFKNNSFINGLLLIKVDPKTLNKIFKQAKIKNSHKLSIDIKNQILHLNNTEVVYFDIDPFRKKCLLRGLDIQNLKNDKKQSNDLQYLLSIEKKIKEFEKKRKK